MRCRISSGGCKFRSSTRRWARAPSPAGRTSISAPRRSRSATTCIGRSTARISSSPSATTRSRSRRSSWAPAARWCCMSAICRPIVEEVYFPASRARRRRRTEPHALGGSARRSAAAGAGAFAPARRRSSPISPTARTKAVIPPTPQRIVHDVRAGGAGGRDRLPRQRHVQDLVRAQLPHPCRQHAAARQCARHDGRWPALGDHGRLPQSAPARARRVRRRRLHDELAGAGDGGPAQAQSRRAGARRSRLRHDPLEAGGRRIPGLRHDLRQSRLRRLCASVWREGQPGRERRWVAPALEAAFAGGGVHLVSAPIDYSENERVLVDELRAQGATMAASAE